MSRQELLLRNLTLHSISVEKYEIHDRQGHNGGHFARVSKNVTSAFSAAKSPSLVCTIDRPVSVQVEPSASCKLSIEQANFPNQILCILFEIEGQRYQSNIIHAICHSQYLMPVDGSPEPQHKCVTVYHPQHHHLIVAFRESYRSWMRPLRDDIPLSALSIPGTHNSPTYHKALPSVRCQCVSVSEQLKKGVRFLDIRVQAQHHGLPLKDGLLLVHSVFPVSLTGPRHFRPLVNEVLRFLKDNPSETVIMSVKREGTGSSNDEHLSRLLHLYYAHDAESWFTAPCIPFLGEARGKIVLLRRFHIDENLKGEWGGAGWGIDAALWADKTPNAVCPSGDVCVQDFYEVLETHNITEKIQYSTEHLRRAAECICPKGDDDNGPKQPFFINFLTASNFWRMGCWPDKIAMKLNPAIVEYLCLKHNDVEKGIGAIGDGSTGIVVCDWVGHYGDWDIVRCIVGMNARFEKPR